MKGRNVKKHISPGYSSLTGIRFVVIVFFGLPLILALIDHTMGHVFLLSYFLFFIVAAVESSPLLFVRSNMQPRIKKETKTNNANSD